MTTSTKTKGFTLIELLVVISIIGVLASIVLAALTSTKVKANDAKKISTVRQVDTALKLYESNVGSVPGNFIKDGVFDPNGGGNMLACEDEDSPESFRAYEQSMGMLVANGTYPEIPRSPDGKSYCYYDYGGSFGEGAKFTAKVADGRIFGSNQGNMGYDPEPDTVTITLVRYQADIRGRLTVNARSSVVSPIVALVLKAGNGFPDVAMQNYGGGAYQVVLTAVPEPSFVTVVSSMGGTDTEPPPPYVVQPTPFPSTPPDTVTITNVEYRSDIGRLTVTARSSVVSPVLSLVLEAGPGFAERALANLGVGIYQTVINSVPMQPFSVTVYSTAGGTATAPPPAFIIR